MTQQGTAEMTALPYPEDLNDDEVKAYLRDNRDFLLKNPKVLSILKAPGQSSGDTVADFQQAMVERLRKDKAEILSLQKELVENARANMSNQSRIHSAILVLLEAENFTDFVQTITQDFPVLLGVDVTTLALETGSSINVPAVDHQGLRIIEPGTVTAHLGEGGYGLLLDNMRGTEDIFGEGAGLVRSQALLRLDIGPGFPKGMLCFGARDPELFQADQGIEQISILSQVVERHIRTFLRT